MSGIRDQHAAVGMAGIAILVVGTFFPLITVSSGSLQASINFYGNGAGDGWVVLVLAGVAAILLSMNKYIRVPIVGILCLAVLVIDYFRVWSAITSSSAPGSNVGYSWGWLLLIAGAIVLILVPLAKPREYE